LKTLALMEKLLLKFPNLTIQDIYHAKAAPVLLERQTQMNAELNKVKKKKVASSEKEKAVLSKGSKQSRKYSDVDKTKEKYEKSVKSLKSGKGTSRAIDNLLDIAFSDEIEKHG